MKYNNMILLSDMDGTLLDSSGVVSEENQRAIKEFIAKGGRFGVATGRNQLNVVSFLQGVEVNAPCILYNGGALYDFETEQFLILCELEKENLVAYLRFCLTQYPEVMIQIYNPDRCSIVSSKEQSDPSVIADHQPCAFCDLEDIMEKPWIKILFCGEAEQLKSMEREMKNFELGQDIDWVFSSEVYLEFLPSRVNKGSMLTRLRELMGSGYKIYAVGDYNNDKEMLKAADVGIAVQNALPSLKKLADVITVSNDNSAIADIIDHIL